MSIDIKVNNLKIILEDTDWSKNDFRHPQFMEDAIKSLEQLQAENKELEKASEWVSVDDRLPLELNEYLVEIEHDSGKLITTAYFNANEMRWSTVVDFGEGDPLYSLNYYATVTRWKPLPKPPEELLK